jgi:hypothetical protein
MMMMLKKMLTRTYQIVYHDDVEGDIDMHGIVLISDGPHVVFVVLE